MNRNTQGHQSFISLSVLSPTHGRSPTRQYPAVVCITAAEIIYPCPRSMEHCEPKYTGTPIIHLPVGFITNPRTEPHTTIPRGCMYHSGRDYLSMPYQHIYYGISKKYELMFQLEDEYLCTDIELNQGRIQLSYKQPTVDTCIHLMIDQRWICSARAGPRDTGQTNEKELQYLRPSGNTQTYCVC